MTSVDTTETEEVKVAAEAEAPAEPEATPEASAGSESEAESESEPAAERDDDPQAAREDDAAEAEAGEPESDAGAGGPEGAEGGEPEGAEGGEPEAEEPKAEPPPPPPDPREMRIRMLEKLVADKDETLREYIKAHKKAGQEFEAFKARMRRDREEEINAAKAKVVETLLEVADNLERTVQAAERTDTDNAAAIRDGVALVHKQLYQKFEELGLERYDPKGEPFDPSSMEALGVVPVTDDALNGKVVVTLQAGFRIHGRELRPAMVQVGRKV